MRMNILNRHGAMVSMLGLLILICSESGNAKNIEECNSNKEEVKVRITPNYTWCNVSTPDAICEIKLRDLIIDSNSMENFWELDGLSIKFIDSTITCEKPKDETSELYKLRFNANNKEVNITNTTIKCGVFELWDAKSVHLDENSVIDASGYIFGGKGYMKEAGGSFAGEGGRFDCQYSLLNTTYGDVYFLPYYLYEEVPAIDAKCKGSGTHNDNGRGGGRIYIEGYSMVLQGKLLAYGHPQADSNTERIVGRVNGGSGGLIYLNTEIPKQDSYRRINSSAQRILGQFNFTDLVTDVSGGQGVNRGVGGSGGRIIIDGDYMPTNSNWRVGGGIGDQKISSDCRDGASGTLFRKAIKNNYIYTRNNDESLTTIKESWAATVNQRAKTPLSVIPITNDNHTFCIVVDQYAIITPNINNSFWNITEMSLIDNSIFSVQDDNLMGLKNFSLIAQHITIDNSTMAFDIAEQEINITIIGNLRILHDSKITSGLRTIISVNNLMMGYAEIKGADHSGSFLYIYANHLNGSQLSNLIAGRIGIFIKSSFSFLGAIISIHSSCRYYNETGGIFACLPLTYTLNLSMDNVTQKYQNETKIVYKRKDSIGKMYEFINYPQDMVYFRSGYNIYIISLADWSEIRSVQGSTIGLCGRSFNIMGNIKSDSLGCPSPIYSFPHDQTTCVAPGGSYFTYGGNPSRLVEGCKIMGKADPYKLPTVFKYLYDLQFPGAGGGGISIMDSTQFEVGGNGGGMIEIDLEEDLEINNEGSITAIGGDASVDGILSTGGGSGGAIKIASKHIILTTTDILDIFHNSLPKSHISVKGGKANQRGGDGSGGLLALYFRHWYDAKSYPNIDNYENNSLIYSKGGPNADIGIQWGTPCIEGFQNIDCKRCESGYFKYDFNNQKCSKCDMLNENRDERRDYHLQKECKYNCYDSYEKIGNRCLDLSEQFVQVFVKAIWLPLVVAIITAAAIVLVYYQYKGVNLEEETYFESFIRFTKDEEIPDIKKSMGIEDLKSFIVRVYFFGDNEPNNPWKLPVTPPHQLLNFISPDKYQRFIDRINSECIWKRWERIVLTMTKYIYPPIYLISAWRMKTNYKKAIRNFLHTTDEDFWSRMKHRELSHKVKFGCSKDNTLAFLDFLDWDRSIHDWIGKPPLPLTIMLSGKGGILQPYRIRKKDPLCLSFRFYTSQYSDEDEAENMRIQQSSVEIWKKIIKNLNSYITPISFYNFIGITKRQIKSLLKYLKAVNEQLFADQDLILSFYIYLLPPEIKEKPVNEPAEGDFRIHSNSLAWNQAKCFKIEHHMLKSEFQHKLTQIIKFISAKIWISDNSVKLILKLDTEDKAENENLIIKKQEAEQGILIYNPNASQIHDQRRYSSFYQRISRHYQDDSENESGHEEGYELFNQEIIFDYSYEDSHLKKYCSFGVILRKIISLFKIFLLSGKTPTWNLYAWGILYILFGTFDIAGSFFLIISQFWDNNYAQWLFLFLPPLISLISPIVGFYLIFHNLCSGKKIPIMLYGILNAYSLIPMIVTLIALILEKDSYIDMGFILTCVLTLNKVILAHTIAYLNAAWLNIRFADTNLKLANGELIK